MASFLKFRKRKNQVAKNPFSASGVGILTRVVTLFCCVVLNEGCQMNSIAQYQHQQPALSIEKFFSGSTKGYGMVQKNSGAVRRRFTVQMSGQWHGKQGTLAEVFTYDDGEEQQRQWQITQLDAHHFNAVAKDVVGIAKGEQYGSAIHMIYTLEIPYQGTTIQMNIDDWLYRIDDHVVLNNATMRKFGIPLGRITASFTKE